MAAIVSRVIKIITLGSFRLSQPSQRRRFRNVHATADHGLERARPPTQVAREQRIEVEHETRRCQLVSKLGFHDPAKRGDDTVERLPERFAPARTVATLAK